jgi:UDP-N-acetylmuramate--alanine ligase
VHIAERPMIGEALVEEAKPGDRILIMGARDDTLIDFASELVERLGQSSPGGGGGGGSPKD